MLRICGLKLDTFAECMKIYASSKRVAMWEFTEYVKINVMYTETMHNKTMHMQRIRGIRVVTKYFVD
jgi:hypothetical protein